MLVFPLSNAHLLELYTNYTYIQNHSMPGNSWFNSQQIERNQTVPWLENVLLFY